MKEVPKISTMDVLLRNTQFQWNEPSVLPMEMDAYVVRLPSSALDSIPSGSHQRHGHATVGHHTSDSVPFSHSF